jgi:hypothetical protein
MAGIGVGAADGLRVAITTDTLATFTTAPVFLLTAVINWADVSALVIASDMAAEDAKEVEASDACTMKVVVQIKLVVRPACCSRRRRAGEQLTRKWLKNVLERPIEDAI